MPSADDTLEDNRSMKLCECGCGKPTTIATKTDRHANMRRGEPMRYVRGHSGGLKKYILLTPADWDVDAQTGCWVWNKSITGVGYGQVSINGKMQAAHRLVYEKYRTAIPAGKDIDHLCRNRRCVNPEHLEVVSRATNIRRGKRAKFTVELVADLRSRYASGAPIRALASLYGVTYETVRQVVRNKSWVGVA